MNSNNQTITQLLESIKGVADQTKLLALSGAIVVSLNDVHSLSQQSTTAAEAVIQRV